MSQTTMRALTIRAPRSAPCGAPCSAPCPDARRPPGDGPEAGA